jgi:raffinose/stachyose/melibiose transport system substrate-binding protein
MIQGHSRLRHFRTLAAVAALGALVLAGCGGGDDGGSGGDGGAANSFSFTFPTSTQTESPWQTIATKYQEETGTQVQAQALPNDSYPLSIRTQLQGGNAPDVIVVSPGAGLQNAVLPLAEARLLEPLGEPSAAAVPENTKDLVSLDGKVYAQPTDLIPVGMTYNPDAAAKAGVTAPSDSNGLIASCRQLAGQGKSFFAVAGSAPPNMGLMAMAISATRVYAQTPDWNQQRASGAVTFAGSKGWQDTLQTIVDMNDAGCFQRGAAGGGFDAITSGITQGKSLAAFVPGGAATELMASTPGLKLEIRPFPPASGGKPYLLASPNYALAISAKSDTGQKQAAQEFLTWLAKPENAAEFTKISGGVPITGVEGATLEPQYEPVKSLLAAGDYAPLPNLEWPNPGIYDAIASGVQGLLSGRGDIRSVLEAADKAWER